MMTRSQADDALLSERLGTLRDDVRKRAYMHENPEDFRAGVEAAVCAVQREILELDLHRLLDDEIRIPA